MGYTSLPPLVCLCLLLRCGLCDVTTLYWQPDDNGRLDFSNGTFPFTYIDVSTFTPQYTNTSAVLELNLANNNITHVDQESLVHLFNLRVLNLTNNAITELSNETFVALRKLDTLDVSYNLLTELRAGLVSVLTLRDVRFNNNNISYVEPGIVGLVNRKLLAFHMEYNALTYMDPWMYVTYQSYNRNVERIFYLQHNKIRALTNYMNWTHDLKYPFEVMVELQFNEIPTINLDTVMQYRPSLTDTETAMFSSFLTFHMNISHNPYVCDCRVFDLANVVQGTIFRYMKVDMYRYRCSSPESAAGWDFLHDLPRSQLVCSKHGSDGCPVGCVCEDRPHNDTYFVQCTGAGLTDLPDIPANNASKIELFLDGNIIETISNVSYLGRVYNISLRNNRMSHLDPEILKQLTTAKKVDLRNNKLTSVPKEIKKFESVSISGNPIECDCGSMWLKEWMDIDTANADPSLSCKAPTGSQVVVMEMTLGDLICTNDLLIIIGCILGVVLVAVIIGIVFAARCPYETKVMLFRWLRVDLSKKYEVDRAEERSIDIYLVFDENDADIRGYVNYFVHALNKNKPIYSVFNPKRFMEPGPNTDNITKYIGKSKRVIVLLSRNIFENHTCMDEITDAERRVIEAETRTNARNTLVENEALREIAVTDIDSTEPYLEVIDTNARLANQRAEEESLKHAARVIYIIYNDDEHLADKLNTEPWKTRLEGKTVLRPDPDDRMFWTKLRYELPRRGQGVFKPPGYENATQNAQPLAVRARHSMQVQMFQVKPVVHPQPRNDSKCLTTTKTLDQIELHEAGSSGPECASGWDRGYVQRDALDADTIMKFSSHMQKNPGLHKLLLKR